MNVYTVTLEIEAGNEIKEVRYTIYADTKAQALAKAKVKAAGLGKIIGHFVAA